MTQQTMNLHQKLVVIRRNIGSITKDKKSFGYDYVSGSQVLSKIHGSMNELNVLLIPNVISQNHEVHTIQTKKGPSTIFVVSGQLSYKWVNADNPSEVLEVPFHYTGSQDDVAKAFGSALTYAERYFLIKFFNLPTDGDDPDAQQPHNGYYQSNNQYQNPPVQQQQQRQSQPPQQPQYQNGTNNNLLTDQQLKALKTAINLAAKRTLTDVAAVSEYAWNKLNIPLSVGSKVLTREQASKLIEFVNQIPAAQ